MFTQDISKLLEYMDNFTTIMMFLNQQGSYKQNQKRLKIARAGRIRKIMSNSQQKSLFLHTKTLTWKVLYLSMKKVIDI